MSSEIVILRLVHVISGMFWVGATIFMSLFLGPVIAGMGPAAGPIMAGLAQRRLHTAMAATAGLTILSGIRLLMLASANFNGGYFQSPVGRTFAIAGGLAITAFIVGMVYTRPAMM